MTEKDLDTIYKKDIFNMMESYRSNVEFNKEMLTSQKRILEEHDKMVTKLTNINKSQETLGTNLEHLIDKLKDHNDVCVNSISTAVSSLEKITTKLDNHNIDNIKSNNSTRNHIITMYATLGSVVISLIVVISKMCDKLELIDLIVKHLGI